MSMISIAGAVLIILCALSANLASAQTVCEQIPAFVGRQALTPQCWSTAEVTGSVLGVDLSKGAIDISLTASSFNNSLDVSVDAFGQFRLSSIPAGDYLLMATQGGRILGFTAVVISAGTPHLIFQMSNQTHIVRHGPLGVVPISEQIGEATFSLGLHDWPLLHSPRCVRSKCYVDGTDELSQ